MDDPHYFSWCIQGLEFIMSAYDMSEVGVAHVENKMGTTNGLDV